MNHRRRSAAVAAAVLATVFSLAPARGQVKAFDAAEGFGAYAAGARTSLSSASVYHVTNLNDSGAGSFRDAVSASNRFVVFDVGGIVNLESTLAVAKSNITIAGQTAPGGITFYGQKVSFTSASNLVSRYVAIRKGSASGREDASGLARGTNMMFDHMSITWGVDETFSMNPDSGYTIDNVTIQNTIIGQGLDVVGHSAGGLMTIGDGRFSVIKSLFADNVTRNPKVRGNNEYLNNVVYGWESAAYIMGDTAATSHANVEGNYFIEGPVNGSGPFTSGTDSFHLFGRDNFIDDNRNGTLDGRPVTSYPGADVLAARNDFPTQAAFTAQQALAYVMQHAGVSITRDAVDARIVEEVASYGTLGGVIKREGDLFPNYGTDAKYRNARARLADADNDGIADDWEAAHGLSAANAADWKVLAADGRTQLENYVNELGNDGVILPSAGGAWTNNATWGGSAPTLADDAVVVVGNLTHAAGNAFARRLSLGGNLTVAGGTLDVFDTATLTSGSVTLAGGTTTFGRLLLGSAGRSASLSLGSGATLRGAIVTNNGGVATIDWNGGTFRASGAATVTPATTLGALGGTFDTNGYDAGFTGKITGTGALTKLGAGTLTLSGANAYAGGTSVTGNLRLASSTAAGTGAINVTAAGGTVLLADGVTVANDLVTAFNFEVLDVPDDGAAATFAGNLTTSGSRQVRLRTTGDDATLNLTGATNAGSQLFIFSAGRLVLKGNGSIAGNGAIVGRAAGDTTFTLQDNAAFNGGATSLGGGQPLTSATVNVNGNAAFNAGANNLDLLASSTATAVSAVNLNGGTTTVGGVVKTSVAAGQTSTLTFNGGTLRYGGAAANANFLAALTGLTANVAAGGARLDDNGQAITVAQPLLHAAALGAAVDGGLTKLGAGTLALVGANTYTGPTTVGAGKLAVNGSIVKSAATVQGGASLGGVGSVGALTANVGSTVAPGNGVGTMTVANNATLRGTLAIELDGTGAGAADRLNVGGTLDLAGGALALTSLATPNDAAYVIATYATRTGTFASVTGMPAGYAIHYAYDDGTGANHIALVATASAVPEPTTLAAIASATTLLRRRR